MLKRVVAISLLQLWTQFEKDLSFIHDELETVDSLYPDSDSCEEEEDSFNEVTSRVQLLETLQDRLVDVEPGEEDVVAVVGSMQPPTSCSALVLDDRECLKSNAGLLCWNALQETWMHRSFIVQRVNCKRITYSTFPCIVNICFEKNFALYTFVSDHPDTSLNRHFLTKQSSPDKRGLTVTDSTFSNMLHCVSSRQSSGCWRQATGEQGQVCGHPSTGEKSFEHVVVAEFKSEPRTASSSRHSWRFTQVWHK